MNIDISNLKKITEDSIQKGKESIERAKVAREEAAKAKIVAEAERIIASIPEKCRNAAEQGFNRILIMQERHHFKSEFSNGANMGWIAEITGGPGILVIEACQKAGLTVDIRHQHDGVGQNDWAELWVSWD